MSATKKANEWWVEFVREGFWVDLCQNEERIQYITVGADSNFEFEWEVWFGHLRKNVKYVNKIWTQGFFLSLSQFIAFICYLSLNFCNRHENIVDKRKVRKTAYQQVRVFIGKGHFFSLYLVHLSGVCCHMTEHLRDNWFPNKGGPQSNDQLQHKASVFRPLGKKEGKKEWCELEEF